MRKLFFVLLLALAGNASALVVFGPPGQYAAAYQFITGKAAYWERLDGAIEKAMGGSVYTAVRFMPCDAFGTEYQRGIVTICYGLVDRFAKAAKGNGNLIAGATIFTILHEAGHGLAAVKGIGLRRPEDNADMVAAVLSKRIGAVDIVLNAMANVSFKQGLGEKMVGFLNRVSGVQDEHSTNAQREKNMICLMVGGDQAKTEWAVRERLIQPERAQRCAMEARQAAQAFDSITQ